MSYIVYVHTNKINNKKYIGLTSKSLRSRANNGEGYKGCDKFYRAIVKYGWDNFTHKILYRNLTKKEAELKEKQLIKEYNTQINGYNIAEGGFAPIMTQNTKDKISKSHYDNHTRKIVVYLPSGKYRIYENVVQASQIMKIDKDTIKGWCDGTIPTTKLKCYYEDDMDNYYEKLRHSANVNGI